jgi:hypothetical protein
MADEHQLSVKVERDLLRAGQFRWSLLRSGQVQDRSLVSFATQRKAQANAAKVLAKWVASWEGLRRPYAGRSSVTNLDLVGRRRHHPQLRAHTLRHVVNESVRLRHGVLTGEREADLDAAIELAGEERIVGSNERGPQALGGRRLLQPYLEAVAILDLTHGALEVSRGWR